MIKIKASQFRQLDTTSIQIVNIYPSYRFGWVESERTFKTFLYFPDTCIEQVVYQGDPSTIPTDGEAHFHLRQQEYDKEVGKFKFTKIPTPNKDFFKNYKKVFDIEVALSTPITVDVWDKDKKEEVSYTTSNGEIVRITAFPASRIQAIAQSMMLTKGIEKVDANVKDRLTGEVKVEKRLPFNWEDAVIPQMIGKAFEFAVDGSGLETKYSYKELPPFSKPDSNNGISIEDVPF